MLETSDRPKREKSDTLLDSALERLPRWIAGVSAAGVVACLVAEEVRFAAGLAVGAAVALLGYWWLYRGIQAAFDSGRVPAPKAVLIRLVLRYPLLVGVVLLFNRTSWLPARAVMLGLFAPLAGALIECCLVAAQGLHGPWPQAKTDSPLR